MNVGYIYVLYMHNTCGIYRNIYIYACGNIYGVYIWRHAAIYGNIYVFKKAISFWKINMADAQYIIYIMHAVFY